MLQDHCVADDYSDHNSKKTTGDDEHEGFVEVKHLDPGLGKAHRPEDAQLLGLLHEVGTHAGTETEEAEEHGDHDDDVEDNVKDV